VARDPNECEPRTLPRRRRHRRGEAQAELVKALLDRVHSLAANEADFRTLLQLSIAQSDSDAPSVASIRGERRLRWAASALVTIARNDARRRRPGATRR
jgi:hypothetical protein